MDSSFLAAPVCWCTEEYERAKARRAKIYGEIVGYGGASDRARHGCALGRGRCAVPRQALRTVKVPIDYINPHATSTPIGDLREIDGHPRGLWLGVSRSRRRKAGASQGATGAHEAIYSLLMMQNGFISESAVSTSLTPPSRTCRSCASRRDNVKLRAALSNSFGFGGTNATLVFKHVDA